MSAPFSHIKQPHSPLLQLPGELRNAIYTLVFTGWQIFPPKTTTHSAQPLCSCRPATTSTPRSRRKFALLVALTKVNRQIRAETKILPYKYSTYGFSQPKWFAAWLEQMEEDVRRTVWGGLTAGQRRAVKRVGHRDVWRTGEFGGEDALWLLGL